MKPSITIPSEMHAKIMTQVAKLPTEVILAALKQLNTQQWQKALDGSDQTAQGVQNRMYHLSQARSELHNHLVSQVEIRGVDK